MSAARTLTEADLDAIADRVARRLAAAPERPWLSTAEAADLLGCNAQTLARRAKRGEVPSHRLGKSLRFSRVELDAWLRSQGGKAA